MDSYNWLVIYLVGCGAALFMQIFGAAFFAAINWATKSNIVSKNLKKVQRPETRSWAVRAAIYIALLIFDVALSWISVLIMAGQILWHLLKTAREFFVSVPEKVKELRFPLRNIPTLETEVVFAYLFSLNVTIGHIAPTPSNLLSNLDEVRGYRPAFNTMAALAQIQRLGAVDASLVDAVRGLLLSREAPPFVYDPADRQAEHSVLKPGA